MHAPADEFDLDVRVSSRTPADSLVVADRKEDTGNSCVNAIMAGSCAWSCDDACASGTCDTCNSCGSCEYSCVQCA